MRARPPMFEKVRDIMLTLGAIGGALAALGIIGAAALDVAPWASKQQVIDSNKALHELVTENRSGVTSNREEILRTKIEWYERRKYDAEEACNSGNARACLFARNLQINLTRERDKLERLEDDNRRRRQ